MKCEMQKFTTMIVNMMKSQKLFESQGGPIILSQVLKAKFWSVASSQLYFYLDYGEPIRETLKYIFKWIIFSSLILL